MINATKKFKHLNLEERVKIFDSLNQGLNLKEISNLLGKDERTIAKEIYKHRFKREMVNKRVFNKDSIHNGLCPRLKRFPRCCNYCEASRYCRYDRYYYDPHRANNDYRLVLSKSRTGYDLDKAELDYINKVVKVGVDKGQSFYAIVKSNKGINKSSRTLYNYLEDHILAVKNIDLRNKVKFKKRNKYYDYRKTFKDKEILNGRKIEDYFRFILNNNVNCPVQLDTVEGSKKCKKVLLTMHFVSTHLMLIYLLKEQTPKYVNEVFNNIEKAIGIDDFKKLFPCILTDRGTEFVDALGIEYSNETGEKRTSLFYCDAYVSNQKAAIESNHRKIRYILPKGSDTDVLNNHHIELIRDNVANYPIRELNGSTPLEVFKIFFGEEIIKSLGMKKIDPSEVNLTPTLLTK